MFHYIWVNFTKKRVWNQAEPEYLFYGSFIWDFEWYIAQKVRYCQFYTVKLDSVFGAFFSYYQGQYIENTIYYIRLVTYTTPNHFYGDLLNFQN